MLSQTQKTFVHLRNTNEDIFDEFWELSDPPSAHWSNSPWDISGLVVILRRYEISIVYVQDKVHAFWTETTLIALFTFWGTLQNSWRRIIRVQESLNKVCYYCFLCAQQYSRIFVKLPLNHIAVALLSMEGQRALRINQKNLNLCSEDERRLMTIFNFEFIWNTDILWHYKWIVLIHIFDWMIPD